MRNIKPISFEALLTHDASSDVLDKAKEVLQTDADAAFAADRTIRKVDYSAEWVRYPCGAFMDRLAYVFRPRAV